MDKLHEADLVTVAVTVLVSVSVLVTVGVAPYAGGAARTTEANRPVAKSERRDMMINEWW